MSELPVPSGGISLNTKAFGLASLGDTFGPSAVTASLEAAKLLPASQFFSS
ncbi:hypothetical protein N9030_01215 [bacterium]|nr:hypothetical protein [bacterium]MDB4473189.1 hypothetical protein [bacterium]